MPNPTLANNTDTALTTPLAEDVIQALRQAKYNAELVRRIDIHDELAILRVRPDDGVTGFAPGQYSVMGLGNWESRVPGCQDEHLTEKNLQRVLKRAYSFSCSIFDDDGRLQSPEDFPYFEFYVVLVREGEKNPPGLTPRLFALSAGDRLFVGPKATGHYTLDGVSPDDNVVFVATGTGEAPHSAMAAHLLTSGHRGRIATVTCVRQRRDLGYARSHEKLARDFSNYNYVALTTREPENLDKSRPDFVGKIYLQEYFDSGAFERDCAIPLDPAHTRVFLCGNPKMIGIPHASDNGQPNYPQPAGMIELLARRGFQPDERGRPGNIHYEKYW